MRRGGLVGLAAVLLVLATVGLWRASTPDKVPTREDQVEAVASTLRCPTCQGLSAADSPSPIAESMREIIAEQLEAGRTPDEVRAFFTARYGEWVLLSPASSGLGWLVWLLPGAAVAVGAAAGLAVVRRRGDARPVSAEGLAAAEETVVAYRAGTFEAPATPAGERLESALALTTSVEDDEHEGVAGEGARAVALERVARALAERDRELDEEAARTRQQDDLPRPKARRTSRGAAWAGGAAAFLLVLAGLLTVNLAPRGAGELPTGNLAEQPARAAAPDGQSDAELARLRAAVEQDPADTANRLVLAGRLLQAGKASEARAQAEAVLTAEPEQVDALLLLGLAQLQQGDDAAKGNLRRFLEAAPEGHPGVDLAERLLERVDEPGDGG